MKIGVLADIHGNAAALDAVLQAARRKGAERLLCAGDFVGYYYEPARCFDLLDEWETAGVRGNHENMFDQLLGNPALKASLTARFGSGLEIAVAQLDARRRAALAALPVTRLVDASGCAVLVCHGAPWDTDEYVYPEAPEETLMRCAAAGADVVVMGHSHCQLVRQVGATLLVNPGSVGQPRRGTGDAEWALLDTTRRTCEPFAEPYDRRAVAARARATDPHFPFLSEILERL